jgi:hypothetical protein
LETWHHWTKLIIFYFFIYVCFNNDKSILATKIYFNNDNISDLNRPKCPYCRLIYLDFLENERFQLATETDRVKNIRNAIVKLINTFSKSLECM